MPSVLGISAFFHDSAAALVVDGVVVAAAQEERFSRIKNDASFPHRAIEYCLEHAGISIEEVDHVAFYEKPFLKFERLLETSLAFAPRGLKFFLRSMPGWLKEKLYLPRRIQANLNRRYRGRIIFPEHHESHAASAFFASPFNQAAILTADGVGEWTTTAFGSGQGSRIQLTHQIEFPHSLGLLYSAFTTFCGFNVNSGEAKLMGLAPYGEPVFADLITERLIDVRDDGSFRLDMSYFDYCVGSAMTSGRFHALFGGAPREPESEITRREMDMAASIQKVVEEVLLKVVRDVHLKTGMKNLCMAGGLGLNCVANGRIRREGPFDDVWVQPAAGDSGAALGAALFVWHQLLGHSRSAVAAKHQNGTFLGPSYSTKQIDDATGSINLEMADVKRYECDESLDEMVVQLLSQQKIVAWFQGRMEFGPRALGNRSILADPRDPTMQDRINRLIKFRECFRPFAPAILASEASRYFDLPDGVESPNMLFTANVRPEFRLPLTRDAANATGLQRLDCQRSTIPAVTHVDWSARVQTVCEKANSRFARLLHRFHSLTGCPMLLNTSLNVRGEPIACSPDEAIRMFESTDLDALVIGNTLITKTELQLEQRQPASQSNPLTVGNAK